MEITGEEREDMLASLFGNNERSSSLDTCSVCLVSYSDMEYLNEDAYPLSVNKILSLWGPFNLLADR